MRTIFFIRIYCFENKRASIITISIAVCVVVIIPIIFFSLKQQSYYGEFYITKTGTCYHEKDCIFVKDKTSIQRLTEGDYYSGKYDPCQICLPHD